MIKQKFTNKELAKAYYEVRTACYCSKDQKIYLDLKKRIADAQINIAQIFHSKRKKSLDNIKIKGIGENTKFVLEAILKDGIEAAKTKLRERLHSNSSVYIPRSARDDYLGFTESEISEIYPESID